MVARVEVFCRKGLAMFDFGEFGVIVEYSRSPGGGDLFGAYFEDDYPSLFMVAIDNKPVKEVLMGETPFKRMREIFLEFKGMAKDQQDKVHDDLWVMLKENFKKYVRKYARRSVL